MKSEIDANDGCGQRLLLAWILLIVIGFIIVFSI
jgi:hypothetical protein